MEILEIKPKTIKYDLTLNKEDEYYSMCPYMEVILEPEYRELRIKTALGDLNYEWGNKSKSETYYHFLGRLCYYYLLRKMSSANVFKLEETKKALIELLKQYVEDNGYLDEDDKRYKICYDDNYESYEKKTGIKSEKELEEMIETINNEAAYDEREFYFFEEDEFPFLDWEELPIIKDYPEEDKIIVKVFIKYFTPFFSKLAKKELEEK